MHATAILPAVFTQTVYIGDRTFALLRPIQHTHELSHPPRSHVYFCPACGDIWARIRSEPHDYWRFYLRRCEAHGEGFLGHIGERGFARNMTHELLRREFLLASNNPQAYQYHYT